MESVGTPLKDWDIQINYGIKTGANEAFIIPTEKREEILNACKTQEERKRTDALIKPILRGKDIKRYSYEWADLWVIATFPSLKLDIDDYPSLKTYLSQFRPRIDQSGEKDCRKKTNNQWFETQDTIAYHEEFEKEKIVYPCIMAKEPCFVYEEKGFYAPAPANIITGDKIEIKYITALLNSKCIYFAMRKFYMGGGIEGELKTNNLEKIPIPQITEKNQKLADKITDCAKAILEAKEKDPKANTQKLEKEIDALVYQLYNLTDEEIKIIEERQEIKSALP